MELKDRLKNLPFKEDVENAGGEIYAVGGAVRDDMLGIESKDLDLLIRLVPKEDLLAILDKYGAVDEVGESFGVIKFTAPVQETIDIALPRTEKSTGDKHTDFEVTVDHTLPLKDDLYRRDFTINAMAMDTEGNLHDPFNGKEAIEKKVINIVNKNAFSEDPLRMLRAVQFASRLGFTIEVLTCAEIRMRAKNIEKVSKERVLIELQKIVDKGNPEEAIKLLSSLDLYQPLFKVHYPSGGLLPKNIRNMAEFFTYASCATSRSATLYKKTFNGDTKTYKLIQGLCKIQASYYKPDMLIRIFEALDATPELINTTIFVDYLDKAMDTFRTGKYPKSLSELKVNGNDILRLGLEGQEVGEAFRRIVKAILTDKIDNEKKQIIKFLEIEFKKH